MTKTPQFVAIASNHRDGSDRSLVSEFLPQDEALRQALQWSRDGFRATEVIRYQANPHTLKSSSALLPR